MAEAYIAIGFIVLIVMVAASPRGISDGPLALNILLAIFVVLLWPVALFLAGGKE